MKIISRKQAKTLKLTQYFTGRPCKHGHIDVRFVNGGSCRECMRLHKKTENSKANYRTYRKKHKGKVNKRALAYWHTTLAVKVKALRQSDPDRGYRYQRKWERENPGKKIAITVKRQLAILRATPKWAESEKKAIEKLYVKSSKLTKQTGRLYTVDHIVPIQGKKVCGLHCLANLRVVLGKTNFRKNNKFEVA